MSFIHCTILTYKFSAANKQTPKKIAPPHNSLYTKSFAFRVAIYDQKYLRRRHEVHKILFTSYTNHTKIASDMYLVFRLSIEKCTTNFLIVLYL